MKKDKVLGCLIGVCVGDSLGVPVEFVSRQILEKKPITQMNGFGTHSQPPGTWSDDSSLTFCLADSLCSGFNLDDIADKFIKWLFNAYWTSRGVVFDVGGITDNAIQRLKQGINPLEAGPRDEYSNGNGSLMRISPMIFYLENKDVDTQFNLTHQVSCLTHGHIRSQMACGIYVQFGINLLKGNDPELAYQKMKETVLNYYSKEPYSHELKHFERILENDISQFAINSINSSGYVIDTLEASLWCLLNHKSYKETVLAAVNLGGDTDTTGAVAGGLAGIYYGYADIPQKWVNSIARIDDIKQLCERFYTAIAEG